jgi:asparagine synthase (glutamine-hydrolysing)
MCGIAGYCGPEGRFSDEKLRRMLRAIAHRGPDDEGVYSAPAGPGGRVWLGSRRLAIQDLSPAGRQPMVEAGRAIAFNGEIYNFLELRSELERQGRVFRSRCDTEVALATPVERWRGMFGAALWDGARDDLLLVRDPWGVKPLYYHLDAAGGLAFCSEVRGLLAADVAPRALSRRGLEDYLRFGAVQDPVTIVDGVYALLPGYGLRWRQGKIELRRYAEESAEPMEAADVEPMLREIVRQQMISDVPVVVFLSGGVDSSVLALLARQEAGKGVQTLSVVFEEKRYSEREYARRVADRIGAEHHEALLRGPEALGKALEAIDRMDQPSIDALNTYVVSQAARQAGFPVALSGLGGDEFFGGYPTFRRAGLAARMQRWAQRSPALAGAAGRALGGLGRAGRKLGTYLESGEFWEHPYFLQRTVFFPRQVEALCRNGRPSAEADQMAEARRQALLEQAEGMDPLNQVSLLEARTYMANMLLRDSDQMSMAHSLELRVPLVDHVLAARLLATPGDRKGFGKRPKLWLRQAFGRWLPEEVFARRKAGFVLPLEVWLRGPLRREVEGTIATNPGGLWDARRAAEVWESFLRREVNWSRPWALFVLSRWAEKAGLIGSARPPSLGRLKG